jgi:hypothetical protein
MAGSGDMRLIQTASQRRSGLDQSWGAAYLKAAVSFRLDQFSGSRSSEGWHTPEVWPTEEASRW